MKTRKVRLSAFATFVFFAVIANPASSMEVSFADAKWDGKAVPTGQQCQKFGGKAPGTPRFQIAQLPSGTTEIVFEYSDRDYAPMDKGGHGIVAYKLNVKATDVVVPSMPGHTFELPSPFTSVKAHQGPGWDKAGAYMPPCSGGKGNNYYVTIKAVGTKGSEKEVLAEKVIEMGKF